MRIFSNISRYIEKENILEIILSLFEFDLIWLEDQSIQLIVIVENCLLKKEIRKKF